MQQPARANLAFVFLIAWVAAVCGARAEDWPQWRGPARNGISTETGLLKQWPAGGPPLVWKSTGLGSGYSTVSVADGRIYTIGDKSGASFTVALGVADGKPLWSSKLGKAGAPGWGNYTGPRSTPSVSGNLVFAVGQWGDLVGLDAATGQERWRKEYGRDFGGERPNWGFAESPLIDKNLVVVTPGGSEGAMVALNKDTGAVVWRSKGFNDNAHYSSIIVAEIGGVRQYIQLTAASIAGVAANDGRLLWKEARKGDTAVIPTPIYSDGMVYVSSGYGVGCNLFKVIAQGGRFDVDQVYANKVMVNHHGGVVKIGDYVYGHSDSKGWTCQNFKTGETKWQDKDKLGKGSLVCADGLLYLRQENKPGTVALIEASPDGYKEHGRFNPSDRAEGQNWSHPVISGGKLYIRDQDALYCYDIKAK